jgi:hypothetical protein
MDFVFYFYHGPKKQDHYFSRRLDLYAIRYNQYSNIFELRSAISKIYLIMFANLFQDHQSDSLLKIIVKEFDQDLDSIGGTPVMQAMETPQYLSHIRQYHEANQYQRQKNNQSGHQLTDVNSISSR